LEVLTEVPHRGRGALDVPARPTLTQGLAGPVRLPVPVGPPEQRVQPVSLAGPVRITAALGEDCEHLIPGPPGDAAETRLGGQVQVKVLGRLGTAVARVASRLRGALGLYRVGGCRHVA